jgi:hypothetical protein
MKYYLDKKDSNMDGKFKKDIEIWKPPEMLGVKNSINQIGGKQHKLN